MKFFNVHLLIGILTLLLFTFSGCDKDDSGLSEEEQEEMNEDPANTTGRFSDFLSCDIIAVPAEVNLNSYYTKYINCSGVPVIGSPDVPDEALILASETVEFMLSGLGNVRERLITDGNYVAMIPVGGSIGDLPENFSVGAASTGAYDNTATLRAAASDVASLLCAPEPGYGHTLVHEMAHMIDGGARRFIDNDFTAQQTALYNQAMSSGKWSNTYAAANPREYLAEGVTIWYGVNYIGSEDGDGFRNNIGTRAELQAYDSGLYNFINTYYNSRTDVPGCRTPVISGVSANCPATVTDIDGNVYDVVNIGPMCWTKQNLKTTKFNDGTSIQNITDNNAWQNATAPAWSEYDNNASNGYLYGKLYNGYALNNTRQLCPVGWHVPTHQELQDLVNYSGGDYASVDLRATTTWNPPGLPATNSSNFTALPSGIRNQDGFFQEAERRTNFGTSTQSNASAANFYSKAIFGDQDRIFTDNTNKSLGLPCRCIKD